MTPFRETKKLAQAMPRSEFPQDHCVKVSAIAVCIILTHFSGCRPKIYDPSSEVWTAVTTNDTSSLARLLKEYPGMETFERGGETILHEAALNQDLKTVEVIVRAEADINAVNRYQETPLQCAIQRNRPDVVEFLLAESADWRLEDHLGQTPLMNASSHGFIEVMKVLIDHGVDVDHRVGNRQTALHQAANSRQAEAIDTLLAAGAQVDILDNRLRTPLCILMDRFSDVKAAGEDDIDVRIVKTLLAAGADPNKANLVEESPASLARKYQDVAPRCAELLGVKTGRAAAPK